jgi:hypothetical protein
MVKRIKFRKEDNKLISVKIFSNGKKSVRLIIDTEEMIYQIVDPINNTILVTGGNHISNYEVLLRNAKKRLAKYLNIKFEKEYRNV